MRESNCHSPFDQKIIIVQMRAIWLPAFIAVCVNRVSILFSTKEMLGELCIKETSGEHNLKKRMPTMVKMLRRQDGRELEVFKGFHRMANLLT